MHCVIHKGIKRCIYLQVFKIKQCTCNIITPINKTSSVNRISVSGVPLINLKNYQKSRENKENYLIVFKIHFSYWVLVMNWFTLFFALQIYWLKDRVEVQPERDSNYIQAADGHLIIIQAREKDRANYTCVAENVANRRLSPPARLNVHGMLRFFHMAQCSKKWENIWSYIRSPEV